MAQRSISGELRDRLPRIVVNLITALLFWFISMVAPHFVVGMSVPGVNIPPYNDASWLVWATSTLMGLTFLIKALSDIIVLVDLGTEITLRRLGIEETRPLKRVARDIVYILLTILIAAAAMPFASSVPQFGSILSTIISLIALGIFLLLIYDIGRILYRVLEDKTRVFANWLASFAEKVGEVEEDDE